jgi:hypothetical protein
MAITIFCFYKLSSLFSPGSYPYAEVYEMDINSPLMIGNIKKFRTNNPTFDISSKIGLTDSFIGEVMIGLCVTFIMKKRIKLLPHG